VRVEELRYLETHGTGTALGDPTETRAIAEELVLPASAHRGSRLAFGGVKANLGHLEPAAGVAGIARCCAQMRSGVVYANAQLRTLNPIIKDLGKMVPLAALALPTMVTQADVSTAGVSSFGYSGTIAHAVLRVPPPGSEPPPPAPPPGPFFASKPYRWVAVNTARPFGMYAIEWQVVPPPPQPQQLEAAAAGRVCWLGSADGAMARALRGGRGLGGEEDAFDAAADGDDALEDARAADVLLKCELAVWALDAPGGGGVPRLDELQMGAVLGRVLSSLQRPPRLLLLTSGAAGRPGTRAVAAAGRAAAWSLLRVLRLELPRLHATSLDALSAEDAAAAAGLLCAAASPSQETEVCVARGVHAAARLRGKRREAAGRGTQLALPDDVACIVTGGTGGLGLHGAKLLTRLGAPKLLLGSRSGRVPPAAAAELAALRRAARVVLVPCDMAQGHDVRGLLCAASADERFVPSGVLHCAGVADKGLAADLRLKRITEVFGPKAVGAWHLHRATATAAVDFTVHYSSVAAALGNVGQGAYAMANGCLDGLAAAAADAGQTTCSMQLPLIAEAGMGATHLNARQMSFRGMATIGVATYLGCLSQVLAQVGAPTGQPVQVLLPWVRAELLESVSVSLTLTAPLTLTLTLTLTPTLALALTPRPKP